MLLQFVILSCWPSFVGAIYNSKCLHLFCDNFLIKFWSDELLNMLNKKRRHVWTRRGVHLDSTHEKEKCCILPKNMNLCVLLLLPTSFCATFILLTTTTNTSSLLLLSSPPSFVSLLFIGYLLKYAQLIINKDTQCKVHVLNIPISFSYS